VYYYMPESKSLLAIELEDLIARKFSDDPVGQKYLERIKEGMLTKHENPFSHLCTYFAPYDPAAKQLFIGNHKKSGLWLVNGGHIAEGETLSDTLKREIDEEWGLDSKDFDIPEPQLLTICPINNPEKQTCTEHFDIWHFIPVDKNTFNPDKEKLMTEFSEVGWFTYDEAMKLNNGDNQKKGITFAANHLFK